MASRNFVQKALQDHPNHSIHVVPTDTQQKYVDVFTADKKKVRKLDTHRVVAQNKQLLSVNPSTTVPISLLNGGQIDFRLEKGVIDLIDYVKIKLNITNNSGGASVLVPAQLLINRVDVYADNGSTLLSQVYGHELYLCNAFLGRTEFENYADSLGLTTAYASAATSIANTGTAELFIPLWQPFTPAKLHAGALSGQLLIRVLFNPTALTHVSGSLVDVTNCTMLIKGRDLHNGVAQKHQSHYYDPIPLCLTFMNIQRMAQSLTLAASSSYSIVLSGIKGIASCFFWTIRPAALTASNVITYTAPETWEVQESDGSSMVGFHKRDAQEALIDYAECFDNLFRKNRNFNCLSFSTNPVLDFISGSNHGYHSFSSFEKLFFTTPAGLSGGQYQIDIICFVHDQLIVNQGRIAATRA